jgi:hypothetical protein
LKRWARTKSLRRENSDAVYKRICDKAFAISPRRNIGIGGYGSRLKAGTTNDFIAASIFKQLSSSGLTGRSSKRRPLDSSQAPLEYRVTRRSLSSGGALRRPGGG